MYDRSSALGHFTYANPEGDLQQGDVISRRDIPSDIVTEFHGSFPDASQYFVILTQSCDLVRRPRPKAEFVSLAPTIPLSEILEERVAESQKSSLSARANVCASNHRSKFQDFLSKLFNNNDPQYFYLHEELGLELLSPQCVLIRCSWAVSTEKYYSTLLQARKLALNEEFRAKLGWLVGNIYSRVATQDWPAEQVRKLGNMHLDGICQWVEQERLKEAEKIWKPIEGKVESEAELRKLIADVNIPSKQEQLLDRMRTVFLGIDQTDKDSHKVWEELSEALKADAEFSRFTK